jgi:hypothetical protein
MQSFVVIRFEVVHRRMQNASIKRFATDRTELVLVGLAWNLVVVSVPVHVAREIT